MQPTALALLPVLQYAASTEDGIVLTGINNGRGFPDFPATIDSFPLVTVRNGIQRRFEQTIKLLNGHADVIAESTIGLTAEPPNDYGICLITLEALIADPGIYRLELYADGELQLSKPMQFVSSPSESFPTSGAPQLSALVFVQAVRHLDDPDKIELLRVMNYDGLEGKKGVTVVSVWDNVTKKLNVEVGLVQPTGTLLNKRQIPIGLTTNRMRHTMMIVNLPAQTFKQAGEYRLTVRYAGKTREFPLIIR